MEDLIGTLKKKKLEQLSSWHQNFRHLSGFFAHTVCWSFDAFDAWHLLHFHLVAFGQGHLKRSRFARFRFFRAKEVIQQIGKVKKIRVFRYDLILGKGQNKNITNQSLFVVSYWNFGGVTKILNSNPHWTSGKMVGSFLSGKESQDTFDHFAWYLYRDVTGVAKHACHLVTAVVPCK